MTEAIQSFVGKLQTAADGGDAQAKEWILGLKSIALSIQQEQLQTQALLQALHDFSVNTLQQQPPQPSAVAAAQPVAGGGLLSHFRGSGFGQAMTQGVGGAASEAVQIPAKCSTIRPLTTARRVP